MIAVWWLVPAFIGGMLFAVLVIAFAMGSDDEKPSQRKGKK